MKHILFNFLKNNVFILLLVVIAGLMQGCRTGQETISLADIKARGYINVGTLYGATSYYVGAEGDTGFEYELAKKYADFLGVQLKISASYSLKDLFKQLENGEVDFLAAGLVVTDKRLAKYRFAPSYNNISQKLVFKQGKERPRKIDDLTGKLMVTADSSHVENLELLANSHTDLTWQESTELDSEELLLKVLDEEIDYTVVDSHTLAVNRRYYPEISIGFTIKKAEPMAWLLADEHDDSILASLIEFFGQVHHDGTLLALDDKYYGHVEQFNYVDTRLFIQAVENKLPQYRPLFEKYGQEIDWKLLAAISYQESHWNPRARSHTGVRGMMMLTLPTAKQMGIKSRIDAEQSIRGGAKYFKQMIDRMPARVPQPDRLWFALASYNVGLGHLNDARKITKQQGGDPDRWVEVKDRLPLLKQKKFYKKTKYGYARGDEPVNYVENIRRYYDTLTWMDKKQQEALEAQRLRLEQEKLPQMPSDSIATPIAESSDENSPH
ncbi:membrane-bound lytic murein transglycosylase MltF [Thalassotalea sp. G2M2-11]|uniref:membrane-bound lytic murein transglycosylase MltF n=1 Tax=Thalassotalea sp. G2M2-11 TaxID=2787627 RepID=UPI0019D30BB6|nr:membrane-bound lytic murein transglycosylase MltF [Thalassotalea sp. G2M2-11]